MTKHIYKLLTLLLVCFTFLLKAQCPSGALAYTGQSNISSGQVYCLTGTANVTNLQIDTGGRLIIAPGAKLTGAGNFIVNGTLEVNGGVDLNGAMLISFGVASGVLELGSQSYLTITGSLSQFDGTIKMNNRSVVEVCATYSWYKEKTAVQYTGTGDKAYFIVKAQASGAGPASLVGDSGNINWIAMDSVTNLNQGSATYCGPNATAATCPTVWPVGLTKSLACNEAGTIVAAICGAVSTPIVSNLKICTGKTANLTNAQPATLPAGATGINWWTDAAGTIPVENPETVGPGTYYATFGGITVICPAPATVSYYVPGDPGYSTACVCANDPATGGTNHDTKVGITLLQRAGAQNTDNWPMTRKSGHLALESNTLGFVPTRMTTVQLNAIRAAGTAVEGMMAFDNTVNCLKIYDGSDWKCFNTPSCP